MRRLLSVYTERALETLEERPLVRAAFWLSLLWAAVYFIAKALFT